MVEKQNGRLARAVVLSMTLGAIALSANAVTPGSEFIQALSNTATGKIGTLVGVVIALYGGFGFYKNKDVRELVYAGLGATMAAGSVAFSDYFGGVGNKVFVGS